MAKNISMLVCFEGKNRRIEINPKKCVRTPNKDFTYKGLYKADNGKTYMIHAVSVSGTNGAKVNVKITNRSGKQAIAERQGVAVRFYRYIFE